MLLGLALSLCIILGILITFLNGAITGLTQDIFSRILAEESKVKKIVTLKKIWDNYDEYVHSLFCLISVILLFTTYIFSELIIRNTHILYPFLISIPFIFGILIVTAIFYFLGRRFSSNVLKKCASIIYIITFPLVPLMRKVDALFIRLSGKDNDEVSIEEITDLVEEAREEGTLDAGEYRLMKNIMKFSDVMVSDVMTPRVVVFSCKGSMTVGEALKKPELKTFSRFPIWEGDSIDDNVLGYVITKQVFEAAINGNMDKPLKDLCRKIKFIPENAELGKALEEFLINKQHLFLVVDEYGGIEGIISMEDVLETMLGTEIVDEADKFVDMRLLAKSKREARVKKMENNEQLENS